MVVRVLDGAGGGAQRAGSEVEGAGGVDDGAANPHGDPALERNAASRVEAVGGLDQAEGGGLRQLLTVGVARVVGRDLEEHVLHERQVALDELGHLVAAQRARRRGSDDSRRPW